MSAPKQSFERGVFFTAVTVAVSKELKERTALGMKQ